MARKLYLIAGIVLVVSSFPTLAVIPDLTLMDRVGTLLTGLGGLSFLLASLRDAVTVGSRTVEWFRFAGAGDIAIGFGLPLSLAASSDDLLFIVASAVAGLVLVIIGLDMLRGGEYVDVRKQ